MSWIISLRPFRLWLLSSLCVLALSACGTVPSQPGEGSAPAESKAQTGAANADSDTTNDPLEGFNRAMFSFNDALDRYLLKPVAKGYRAIMPKPVSKGISNFFTNLREPKVMLNNLLQGKPGQAASDLGRFLVNTTVGIAGLFDVATRMGLQLHEEDFGQTLAVWGVGEGPYLVLPFFGPSNFRDAPSLYVDWQTYIPGYIEDTGTRDKVLLLDIIDRRAQRLDTSDILDEAAGKEGRDRYVFVREAYRQIRRNDIYDGNPPQPPPPPGLFEEDEPAPKSPKPSAPGGTPQSR